jgi:hypothetical protein
VEAAHDALPRARQVVLHERRQAGLGPVVGAEGLEEEAALVGEKRPLDDEKPVDAAVRLEGQRH